MVHQQTKSELLIQQMKNENSCLSEQVTKGGGNSPQVRALYLSYLGILEILVIIDALDLL